MPEVSTSNVGSALPEADAPPAAGLMLTFPAEAKDYNDFQDNYNMMEGEN